MVDAAASAVGAPPPPITVVAASVEDEEYFDANVSGEAADTATAVATTSPSKLSLSLGI